MQSPGLVSVVFWLSLVALATTLSEDACGGVRRLLLWMVLPRLPRLWVWCLIRKPLLPLFAGLVQAAAVVAVVAGWLRVAVARDPTIVAAAVGWLVRWLLLIGVGTLHRSAGCAL